MPWANAESAKRIVFAVAACGLVLLFAQAHRERGRKAPPSDRVTQAAGEPVAEGEWELFRDSERASVFNYFHGKYGAEDGPGFWTRDFHGEPPQGGTPAAMLRERARRILIRIKIEQKLARQEGLLTDIGWDAFLNDLARENGRRDSTVRAGGVVYGPKSFDARTYFDYRHSNMVIELKRRLAAKGVATDEAYEREIEKRVEEDVKTVDKEWGAGVLPLP